MFELFLRVQEAYTITEPRCGADWDTSMKMCRSLITCTHVRMYINKVKIVFVKQEFAQMFGVCAFM